MSKPTKAEQTSYTVVKRHSRVFFRRNRLLSVKGSMEHSLFVCTLDGP